MKIKYNFVNGESIEIEVDDKIGEVILELDRSEYNSNRKETRRHDPISDAIANSLECSTYEAPSYIRVCSTFFEPDDERIAKAVTTLTAKQKEVIEHVYFRNLSIREYAEMKGIAIRAAHKVHVRALERIEKYLEKIF